jgi:hypothetical protein
VLNSSELQAAGLSNSANLGGLVTSAALMDKLSSDLGSQFLKFVSAPS